MKYGFYKKDYVLYPVTFDNEKEGATTVTITPLLGGLANSRVYLSNITPVNVKPKIEPTPDLYQSVGVKYQMLHKVLNVLYEKFDNSYRTRDSQILVHSLRTLLSSNGAANFLSPDEHRSTDAIRMLVQEANLHVRFVQYNPEDPKKFTYPRTLEDIFHIGRWVTTNLSTLLKMLQKRYSLKFSEEQLAKWPGLVAEHFPNKDEFTFEIVTGDDLITAYREGVHSCMVSHARDPKTPLLALYRDHPEKIALVKIYRNKQYVARALLWTTDQDMKLLDRIYPSDMGVHTLVARQWAQDQGFDNVTKDSAGEKESRLGRTYTVTIENATDVIQTPYLDTMCYLNNWLNEENNGRMVLSTVPLDTTPLMGLSQSGYTYAMSFDARENVFVGLKHRAYGQLTNPHVNGSAGHSTLEHYKKRTIN